MRQIEKKINPKMMNSKKTEFIILFLVFSQLFNYSTNQLFPASGREIVMVQPGPLLLAAFTVPPMS